MVSLLLVKIVVRIISNSSGQDQDCNLHKHRNDHLRECIGLMTLLSVTRVRLVRIVSQSATSRTARNAPANTGIPSFEQTVLIIQTAPSPLSISTTSGKKAEPYKLVSVQPILIPKGFNRTS